MTSEHILRGNRIIAEFMGVKPKSVMPDSYYWNDAPFFYVSYHTPEKVMDAIIGYVKYRTDWNWLMKVVVRIEQELNWGLIMCPDMCYWNQYGDKPEGVDEDFYGERIECVYDAVVAFIEWHNEQNR